MLTFVIFFVTFVIFFLTFESFIKNKTRIQKLKGTVGSGYIYRNELHKACFQHDMIYWDFKDLPRRVGSDKVLHDKAFKIDSDSKYDGY